MATDLLKDTTLRSAKPSDKDQRLLDGAGLYLLLKSTGAKWWRFDYSFSGKRKTLSFGTYPKTSLAEARKKRTVALDQVAQGIDPSALRKQKKADDLRIDENITRIAEGLAAIGSFKEVALEWGEKKVSGWSDKNCRSKRMLERNIFPWIGGYPIADLLPMDILTCLRRIEDRGTIETAHRTLQLCGQVCRYAVSTGRAVRDITPDLRGALPPTDGGHFAAITEPKQVAELLRCIDGYQGGLIALSALKLAPLVFVRPGELRAAEWAHIDLAAKEWRYFVSKTKVQHIVPLSDQAVGILTELNPLTRHGRFVFPSERNPMGDRCMSENTLNAALKRLGYGKDVMTAHGFRAMARTILDEVLSVRVDLIEHQLAHAVKDPNGRAYNRTAHLPARHKMMQEWADYLDGIKAGAEVLAFRKMG
ncbi:MAG: integrase arm-type DNA-binding domain-containing protein [Methylococcaceae bacterium]